MPEHTDEEKELRERIAAKTAKGGPDDCWLWFGSKRETTSAGVYRAATSVNRKTVTTARVVWTLEHGEIPAGQWVLHTCDNSMCVNPRHLYLGDMMRNIADRVERRRSPTVLNAEIVGKIMELKRQGKGRKATAKILGVKLHNVKEVLRGGSWSHLTGIKPRRPYGGNGHVGWPPVEQGEKA